MPLGATNRCLTNRQLGIANQSHRQTDGQSAAAKPVNSAGLTIPASTHKVCRHNRLRPTRDTLPIPQISRGRMTEGASTTPRSRRIPRARSANAPFPPGTSRRSAPRQRWSYDGEHHLGGSALRATPPHSPSATREDSYAEFWYSDVLQHFQRRSVSSFINGLYFIPPVLTTAPLDAWLCKLCLVGADDQCRWWGKQSEC